MKTVTFMLVGLLLVCSTAFAAPFDPGKVPADATWLIHLDVDAMHDSVVVEKALDTWMEKENGQKHLDKAREELGIDLREDIHSVTLYNTGHAQKDGVMVATGQFDREKLVEKVERANEHTVTNFEGVELHTWADHKREGRTSAGAFFGNDTLVIGSNVELVKEAISVLAGDRPGLSDENGTMLAGSVPEQAILIVRVIGLADAELPKKSELPEGIDQLSFTLGERDEEVFVVGRAASEDPQTAKHLKEALEGLRSMALLMHGDTEGRRFLEDATITHSGYMVEFELAAPAEVVWKAMKKAKGKKKRDKAANSD